MELTWFFTVLGLMLRPAAISAFDFPVGAVQLVHVVVLRYVERRGGPRR